MKKLIFLVTVLLISTQSCKKEIYPTTDSNYYMGLKISNYESHDGTNYLEDLMVVFPDTIHSESL